MEVIKGRMYDYNNGRFLSVDPFIQSPTSTQSMNPYTYIFNNPLSGVDPTGYECTRPTGDGGCKSAPKPKEERKTGQGLSGDWRSSASTGNGIADFRSQPNVDDVIKNVDGAISELQSVVSEQLRNAGPNRQDKISVLNNSDELQLLGELKSFRKVLQVRKELYEKHCKPNCIATISPELAKHFIKITENLGVIASYTNIGAGSTSGAKTITTRTSVTDLENAVFAQVKAKGSKPFSVKGQEKFTNLAGQQITTVDDLTNALTSGIIKPSQISLDYVVKDGVIVISNTRTSTALINAGVSRRQWIGINKTGVEAYEGKTFDSLVQDQLDNNYGGSIKNARKE